MMGPKNAVCCQRSSIFFGGYIFGDINPNSPKQSSHLRASRYMGAPGCPS